jgi:HEAT repeat protein
MTERLGSTRSPLTIEELLEALHDPRFFVRFEAIVSMARHGPDPRLTDALIETLEGNDPSLSTIAAWGLGRIGDDRALEALRGGLEARYRSVQAHCARSLGNLGDRTVLPILLDRLASEQDVGLQMAFASTLGILGATEATGLLLELLRDADTEDARMELTLAVARLAGEEHPFIQMQRRATSEPGTTFSQAVTALRNKLAKSQLNDPQLTTALDDAAEALAQDDLARGVDLLCAALQMLPNGCLSETSGTVVGECVRQMKKSRSRRIEYVILALHAADCTSGG